jgi:hypothetical protein
MPAGVAAPWAVAGRRLGGPRGVWGGQGHAHTAPGACIRSDTGCIPVGSAEVEGVEQEVEIGALQPQGLGSRRMIALGLGRRLAQQLALEGHRGVMIRQGGRGERREEWWGSHEGRRQILKGDLGSFAEDDSPLDHIGQLAHIAGPGIGEEALLHARRQAREGFFGVGGGWCFKRGYRWELHLVDRRHRSHHLHF